jgi:hypothetical protein
MYIGRKGEKNQFFSSLFAWFSFYSIQQQQCNNTGREGNNTGREVNYQAFTNRMKANNKALYSL